MAYFAIRHDLGIPPTCGYMTAPLYTKFLDRMETFSQLTFPVVSVMTDCSQANTFHVLCQAHLAPSHTATDGR